MSSVVFDIETLALPLAAFDDVQLQSLLKFASSPEEQEAELQKMSLSALTGQIITIAMINPETMGGKVYYNSSGGGQTGTDPGGVEYLCGDEAFILTQFWDTIRRYDKFITFNGRTFDCPFILLRSAILGIRPARNLMPYRYKSSEHCDLLDQMTFYGATRKFSLDFFCKAFGIRSPKEEGISGEDVAKLHAAQRYREIAEYCVRDVRATAELYRRWNEYLNLGE